MSQLLFEREMNSISWLLIRLMLVMVPIVFFANGLTDGDWLEAGVFALSVGVGLTPEMLPMIITASLAKGSIIMAKEKVVIKKTQCYPRLRGNRYPLYG